MRKYALTIGLNDRDTESQLVATAAAEEILADILLNQFEIFAFTMMNCKGCYKMASTENIIREESIRIEIASSVAISNLIEIVEEIKKRLNQESVMVETSTADIDFI